MSFLTLPTVTLPAHEGRLRRVAMPQLGNEHRYSQTFVMNKDGLDGIEFGVTSLVSPPAGFVVLHVFDATNASPALVRTDVIPAAEVGRRERYLYVFEPIRDSANRRFELEISGTADIALVATKGYGYPDGSLTIDGRARWADLVFQTSTLSPVRSTWATLWAAQRDSPRCRDKLILPLLGLNWFVAGVVLQIVVRLLSAPSASD